MRAKRQSFEFGSRALTDARRVLPLQRVLHARPLGARVQLALGRGGAHPRLVSQLREKALQVSPDHREITRWGRLRRRRPACERDGRLVVVDESPPRCNMATDIAALVSQNAFGALEAPVRMVTAPHTPVPFAPELEDAYIPSPEKIAQAVRDVAGYGQ